MGPSIINNLQLQNHKNSAESTTKEFAFEPRPLTFLSFIAKVSSGIGAGIIADMVLVVFFVLSSSLFGPVLAAGGDSGLNPMAVLILIITIFFTSLASNMVGPTIAFYGQKPKYQKLSTALGHILVFNILILLFLLPFYVFSAIGGTDFTIIITLIHIIATTLATAIVFEVISNLNYSLVGIYGSIIGVIFGLGINATIYAFTQNMTIMIFAVLPVIWISMAFVSAISEAIYRVIYTTWGQDFLLVTANYGQDYGQSTNTGNNASTPTAIKENQDEAGQDFLRKHQ